MNNISLADYLNLLKSITSVPEEDNWDGLHHIKIYEPSDNLRITTCLDKSRNISQVRLWYNTRVGYTYFFDIEKIIKTLWSEWEGKLSA